MEDTSNNRKIDTSVIGLSLLCATLLITYVGFSSYKPKILAEIREVKGARTSNISIPFPKNTKILADDVRSQRLRQITLSSTLTSIEINNFYSNVLLSKGYKVEKEGTEGIFYATKYRKNLEVIIVSTSKQKLSENEQVIVNIEIQND